MNYDFTNANKNYWFILAGNSPTVKIRGPEIPNGLLLLLNPVSAIP